MNKFEKRLKNPQLLRSENPSDHVCAMFYPVDVTTKKVFLGHHKKANDWISPGGHIDEGELPVETAARECCEELNFKADQNSFRLFDIDYLKLAPSKNVCRIHWHIVYLLPLKETQFSFTKEEFYDAGWFGIDIALKLTRIPTYRNELKKLQKVFTYL